MLASKLKYNLRRGIDVMTEEKDFAQMSIEELQRYINERRKEISKASHFLEKKYMFEARKQMIRDRLKNKNHEAKK